jgi:hypothetical protein
MTRLRVAPVLCSILLGAASSGAYATVGCVNESPNTILEQSRDASKYVFIARITSLRWTDALEGSALSERVEFPSGPVRATYKLLSVIKGGVPPFETIDQMIYGHGDRSTLRVATDYIFMMYSSTAFDWWGPTCLKGFQEINFNGFEGWRQRMQSVHPDRIGSPLREPLPLSGQN